MSASAVTTLIVTYNHGRYVAEAVRSALGQTRPPDEVLVVDDGSEDDTIDRARGLADSRIRVLGLPHRGVAALADTYNEGLAASRGELIAILEGDDRWPSRKLEAQLPVFGEPDVVLSHGNYAVIGAQGAVLRGTVEPPLDLPVGTYDARPYLLLASYIMAVTVVLRRRALLDAGGFAQLEGTPHWDYPTFLALAQHGSFHYQRASLGEWRRQATSVTHRLAGRDVAGATLALELALRTRARVRDLSLPSAAAITRAWEDAHARTVWQNSRILLLDRRYAEARALLLPTLRRPCSPGLRARLLLAAVAATTRLSLEPVARLFAGRSAFEELD